MAEPVAEKPVERDTTEAQDTTTTAFAGEVQAQQDSRETGLDKQSDDTAKPFLVDVSIEGEEGKGAETNESPPKSPKELGSLYDSALGSKDFTNVNAELGKAIQNAYKEGGSKAVEALQYDINANIEAKGKGPLFIPTEDGVDVHHVRSAASPVLLGLTEQEAAAKGIFNRPGVGWVKDLSDPVKVTLKAEEKPEEKTETASSTPEAGLEREKPADAKTEAKLSEEFPSMYVLGKALQAAGLDTAKWKPTNPEQKYAIDHLATATAELEKIPDGIIDGMASEGDEKPVNKFLKDKGFDIQLNPIGPNEVAMAGTLQLKGAWAGRASEMEVDGKKYDSVVLNDFSGADTFKVGDRTVAKLYSKDGVTVYATPYTEDLKGFEVAQKAKELTPGDDAKRDTYTNVELPMVDMDSSVKLSGLLGMSSEEGNTISQAKMQTKLKIDEKGFSAEQGVAVASSRGFSSTFEIKDDFLFWAVADGASEPLFATMVGKENWKDPKK